MTSKIIPDAVALAQAEAQFGEDGTILIKSGGKLTRAAAAELKQMGVKSLKRFRSGDKLNLSCWLQALPLIKRDSGFKDQQPAAKSGSRNRKSEPSDSNGFTEKTPILFHLPGEKNLADLAGEMLRLGNDRQSFRYLQTSGRQPFENAAGENGKIGGEPSSLLRVIGPPYYSLLRALDSESNGSANGEINAFVETHPRVWVQCGYEHPLGAQVKPPAGKWLLIRPNHSWLFIKEAPFRDIYESLEFDLPDVATNWKDQPLDDKIKVSMTLTRGSTGEPASMWVLHKNSMAQLEKVVTESNDQLVKRLAFAVVKNENGTDPTVIVRVRPSKKSPPVLVLDGILMRPYQGVPNLFVPVGMRVHPPLRRDALMNLMAPESSKVVWLEPKPESDDEALNCSFSPNSIEDAAFRPITDWVEYVLDHEFKPLEAWMASNRYDFESFVCDEDRKNQPKKKGPPKKIKSRDESKAKGKPKSEKSSGKANAVHESKPEDDIEFVSDDLEVIHRKPDELQAALNKIETSFLELDEPLDAPARLPLWREMGLINAKLEHRNDSTICWSNAIWNSTDPAEKSQDYAGWLKSEIRCSPHKSFSPRMLDGYFKDKSSRPLDSSLVAAYLVWAADQETIPDGLTDRLNQAAQFFERQEQYLPVRTTWLVWKALFDLSGEDTLLLARARDRILQRLFEHGLGAEYDMPSFMRAQGVAQTERFRMLLGHVIELHGSAVDWIEEPVAGSDPKTKEYASLMFAYGLAKLGEISGAKATTVEAIDALTSSDPIHNWLGNAFEYRITQALNGQSGQNQLSAELLDRFESMDKMDRYKIDRLRGLSRILEPHERLNAFTRWHRRHADDLAKRLSMLVDITDRDELREKISGLLKDYKSEHIPYGRVLASAMELAPRLGEELANHLFDEVVKWLGVKSPTMARANLLNKSMYVAAHFNFVDVVQTFVNLFEKSLSKIVEEYLMLQSNHNATNKEQVDAIESLFTQSFRGLRKLGMREEIGRIYTRVEVLVKKHEPEGKSSRKAKNSKTDIDVTRPMRLLMCVAAGWYYFGQEKKAKSTVDHVRKILLKKELPAVEQKDLACAYVNCVSHAPVDQAVTMIKELFQRQKTKRTLPFIKDNMTTSSHYSITQLSLIESTVLALVSDEFSLNDESRRWLDEDEFLVRSRIHEDVRQSM